MESRVTLNLSNALNFIRWMAAFMVVAGHLKLFLFLDYDQVQDKTFLHSCFILSLKLNIENFLLFSAILIVCYMYSYFMYLLFERHTENIKNYLIYKLLNNKTTKN